jgi:hypothetical protein
MGRPRTFVPSSCLDDKIGLPKIHFIQQALYLLSFILERNMMEWDRSACSTTSTYPSLQTHWANGLFLRSLRLIRRVVNNIEIRF